jgi:hypothetical protein
LLLCVSSPYAQRGELWRNYNLYFGQVSDTLVWQGASLDMNPCLPESEVRKAYAKDPVSASAEFGAQFREATNDFISLAMIASRTSEGITERPYRDDHRYVAFCDSSGGKGDSACLAIGHYEDKAKQAVLDVLREIEAPHSPEHACAEFAAIMRGFHCHEVILDRFATSFVAGHFQRAGISYKESKFNRSQLYVALLPHLNSGTILLLDNERMAQQFAGLVRSPGRNADAVDHRSGAHDDCSNACAGCLVEIFEDHQEGQLGVVEFQRQVESGQRRDPSIERPRTAKITRSEPAQPQKTPCALCGSPSTRWIPGGRGSRPWALQCDCGAVDGVLPANTLPGNLCPEEGCELTRKGIPMKSLPGGAFWCQNHGQFSGVAMAKQMTWKQYNSGARAQSFGMGQFAIDAHSDDEISDKISRIFDLDRNRRNGGRP